MSDSQTASVVNRLEASIASIFELLTLKATSPQLYGDDGGRQAGNSREESKECVATFVQCIKETLTYVDELEADLPTFHLKQQVSDLQEELSSKAELVAETQTQLAQWRASHKKIQNKYEHTTSLSVDAPSQ